MRFEKGNKINVGRIPWNKGKHLSKEYREKISKSLKGNIPWNKGKRSSWLSERNRVNNPMWNKKIKEKQIKSLTGRKLSREHIKKCLSRRTPSSLEKKFMDIITKHNLPYKFVGNGEFFIGKKCPDFVNVNGEKIAIEVFYRRHKEQFSNGLDRWMEERKEIFNSYGWKTLFFNEIDVNEKEILRRIG